MEIDKKLVGERISVIRKSLGLTMEQFGHRVLNADRSLVSKWERGKVVPNNARVKIIAELGSISVNELLYGKLAFNDLSDEEKAMALEIHKDVLSKRKAGRTRYILDFLDNISEFKSHDEALSLLSNAIRYSFIVEKYSNEGTKLIGLLDHIIKILNDYTESGEVTSGKTKEEVRENLIGYLDYILDNSKNKIE